MNFKKVKRSLALALSVACVCSGMGNITVSAATATDDVQQTASEEASVSEESVQADTETTTSESTQTVTTEASAENEDSTTEGKVTFGVVSDTHVTASKTTEQQRLAEAFQRFSSLGLDRMVVVGDLTDGGSESEYDTWASIKDENLTIPLIASMGNHEGNSAAGFEEATGNIPNNNQVVNGYHFITLSPGSGTLDEETGRGSSQGGGNYTYTQEWLKEQLDAAVAEDPTKPIFVFFHHPIKNTFYVSHEWYGSGLEEIFADYPQVVSFSGHIHSPNNNPTSIWQDGGYTAVNTVTLSYMELETGMIYGSIPPNANNVAQGLEVSVDGSVVTIKNYDFIADQYLDQTWTFDVTKDLPYTEERKENAVKPEFDEEDEIRLTDITDETVAIEFDQASIPENTVGDIVHSYRYDFIDPESGEVVNTFKTWSEYYFTPMPETISYEANDLEPGTSYELQIHAYDAYGLESNNYLSETFTTTGQKEDLTLTFDDMTSGVPAADLLDVDFADGIIADHSAENHSFYGSDGSNIVMNEELGKYVAEFTGQDEECFKTDWTSEQYTKTSDGFTMESVVYVEAFDESYVNLFANLQSAGIGFEIYPNSDDASKADVSAWVHIDGSYQVPRANAAIEFNTWNHIAVTYNGEKVILYVNGEKVSSIKVSGEVKVPGEAYQYYVIGGDTSGDGAVSSVMSGAVSTARIYSESLTAKQLKMLAARDLTSLDAENPLIQVDGTVAETGKQGEAYTVPAAKAADNSTNVTIKAEIFGEDGQIVYTAGGDSAEVAESTFTPDVAGSYTLVYTAADGAGNTETAEYAITVEETDEPDVDEPETDEPDTDSDHSFITNIHSIVKKLTTITFNWIAKFFGRR